MVAYGTCCSLIDVTEYISFVSDLTLLWEQVTTHKKHKKISVKKSVNWRRSYIIFVIVCSLAYRRRRANEWYGDKKQEVGENIINNEPLIAIFWVAAIDLCMKIEDRT